jgi:hypothetical protein
MTKIEMFMNYFESLFSAIPSADVEIIATDGGIYEVNVYKEAKTSDEETAYLRGIKNAVAESKLEMYANVYNDDTNTITAVCNACGERIEFYIETEIYKD